MILSGGTPNFSCTPTFPRRSLDIVFTHSTWSETSCVRSLSPVEITVFQPWTRSACVASVPMTSSASTPSTTTTGHPKAAMASSSGSIW